jgi:ATP-dependent DNA helicase RecQ
LSKSLSILKKYWGHEQFRPGQEDIINAIIEGYDVLALLPTGGGKSICFQIPAMMTEGICIVISPLIALMKDQVENLNKKGINALAIYSGMNFFEVKRTLQNAAFGDYKFLYVSPERLSTSLFEEFLPAIKPTLIAIDEAHCISQWGYDFRPSYLKISKLREQIPFVPIIALTASATVEVQNDICNKLLFKNKHQKFQQSFARPNLSYSVIEPNSKQSKLIEILQKFNGSSIVYCKSRKQTQQISELINQHNLNADYYHAGLNNEERTAKQNAWINNIIRTIVCTNAFGMGIDKPDVRLVVHYNMPESIENYYQEAGRAGRDGNKSFAVLLKEKNEDANLINLNEQKYPDIITIKKAYVDVLNFLQVPAGNGEGLEYDFDIAMFAENFKWNILSANYCLQSLANEGLMYITENNFKPSNLVFTVSKEVLLEFEIQQPHLEPMIKALLRNYPGIFNFPCTIYESLLAKFLHAPIDAIKKHLNILNQFQIVSYKPQSEKTQLTLLQNRMYQDDFKFNSKNIEIRKQKNLERINAIIDFTNESIKCRAVMIGNYFNDRSIQNCGICDNCIEKNKEHLHKNDFDKIANELKNILKSKPQNLKQITLQMNNYKIVDVETVIKFLLIEEIINNDSFGNYFLL